MGLLDSLAGQMPGGAASGPAGQSGLLDVIGNLIRQHPGGLAGLVASFEQGGLGGAVSSWVGTGANQPISPDQLRSVLGSDQIGSIAESLDLSQQEASGQLSDMLPQVIDRLTPRGALPEGGDALGSLLGMLGDRQPG